MTRLELLDALATQVKALLTGYSLPNKNGVLQEVKVHTQWLPQGQGLTIENRQSYGLNTYDEDDYAANFPCVIVRIEDMLDTEENKLTASTVTMKIITGIYDANPECQGYRDILGIQEMIRRMVLEQRILAGKYILRMPLKSRLLDSDLNTWPIWYGEQEMVYTLGRPVRDWEYVHGNIRPPAMRGMSYPEGK